MEAIISFLLITVNAQVLDTVWTKTYGGDYSDWAYDIQMTSDNNYILAGRYSLSDSCFIYVMKLDPWGDTLWTRKYVRGVYGGADKIRNLSDGGYVLIGSVRITPGSDWCRFIMRVDSLGNPLYTNYYTWLFYGVEVLSEDEILFTGGDGDGNLLLYKTDLDGDSLWTRIYQSDELPYMEYYGGYSVKKTNDDGFIIGGATWPPEPLMGSMSIMIKTDFQGDTLWTQAYNMSPYGGLSCIYDIECLPDNQFIAAGYDGAIFMGPQFGMLLKFDSLGNVVWARHLPDGFDVYCHYYSLVCTDDNNYLASGFSRVGSIIYFYLTKFDVQGNELWSHVFGEGEQNVARSAVNSLGNTYTVAGYTDSPDNNRDIYVVNFIETQTGISVSQNIPNRIFSVNYPNPFNTSTAIVYDLPRACDITIEIHDILGRRIAILQEGLQSAGHHQVIWNTQASSSGIYIYRIAADGYSKTDKMMLIK